MQVLSFAAKHAFVYRVIFVTLDADTSVLFAVHDNSAANATIATGCFVARILHRTR